MADLGEWWLKGGNAYDHRLRKDIDSFDDDLFTTESRPAGKGSGLAEVQGTLTARVDRLSSALDALLELVDVRAELTTFAPAAMVRLAARRRFAASGHVAAGESFAGGTVEDVPGYWLPPALAALDDLAAGGDGGADAAEARRRDGVRSGLFWMLALGRGSLGSAPPPLEPLIPPRAVDGITRAGRLAWVAAAEGRLGAASRFAVARHLDDLRDGLEPDEAETARAEWHAAITSLALPAPVEIAAPLTTDAAGPLVAAARLAILASWCAPSPAAPRLPPPPPIAAPLTTDRPLVEAPIPAQAGAPRAPDEAEPSVLLLPAPPAPPGRRPPRLADGITELLRYLIEEGSTPEIELSRRDSRLRDVARGRAPEPAAALDENVGVVADLLYQDALGDGASQRALALWVGRAWVVEAAEILLQEAKAPPVSRVEVRVGGARLTVREHGPRSDELTVAVKMAAEEAVPDSGSHNPLARRRLGQDRDRVEADLRGRLQAAAARATKVLAEHRERCQAAVAEATASVAAIRRAFGMDRPAD